MEATAEAVQLLSRLHHRETLKKLREHAARERGDTPAVQISHGQEFLSSRAEHFWSSCFLRLFPFGDCAEKCRTRPTALPSERWSKCLLSRTDTRRWRCDVEFVATAYNVSLRRNQISAVQAYMRSHKFSDGELESLQALQAQHLVATAIASGDVNTVKEALKKKGLHAPVMRAFRAIQVIQRDVRGSESEKDRLIPKCMALRLWSGCSSIFFTLNPHDIRSPVTMMLLQGSTRFEKEFSLDLGDDETDEYVRTFSQADRRRLHREVAAGPVAATYCFHWTVQMVLRTLLNCSDRPGGSPDGIAARETPGIFGHVRAYFGVVEPQMRKALHIHMLIQLHGFSHPQDLFHSNVLEENSSVLCIS